MTFRCFSIFNACELYTSLFYNIYTWMLVGAQLHRLMDWKAFAKAHWTTALTLRELTLFSKLYSHLVFAMTKRTLILSFVLSCDYFTISIFWQIRNSALRNALKLIYCISAWLNDLWRSKYFIFIAPVKF